MQAACEGGAGAMATLDLDLDGADWADENAEPSTPRTQPAQNHQHTLAPLTPLQEIHNRLQPGTLSFVLFVL